MIEIRKLAQLNSDDLRRLVIGYVSDAKYAVKRTEGENGWVFALGLVPLAPPYRKRYDHLNATTIADFERVVALGFSFAAYEDGSCMGVALAEPQDWNKCYWVHELHAAPTQLRRGIGRLLVDALVAKGRESGLRTLLCETQNTNVPAIRFYRKMGFALEGLDLSHYRNTDYPDGEIMISMKKPLAP